MVPKNPSLGSANSLEWLIELEKPIYLLDDEFITKDFKNKNQQPDEETCRLRSQTKELLSLLSVGPRIWKNRRYFFLPHKKNSEKWG